MFVLALVYNVLHAASLFYQVITLNVAVNSYSNALLSLLMSNQFVEIKSTVFKKFEKENLFQLTCADVVERFQLWLMLVIIGLRNVVEVGGLTVAAAPEAAAEAIRNTTIPIRSNSILPDSFTILPVWTGEVLSPFLIVLGSEMLVDWVKHAYISKFNSVKPAVYQKYLDVLAKDYYTNASMPSNPKHTALTSAGICQSKSHQAAWIAGDPTILSLHPCISTNISYVLGNASLDATSLHCYIALFRQHSRLRAHCYCGSIRTF